MRHDEALEGMLEAGPAELRGDGDTELARHIAGCDRCAAAAATILDELDAVDRAVAHLAADGPGTAEATAAPSTHGEADAAVDAALAAIRTGRQGDVASLDPRRRTEVDGEPSARGSTADADRSWLRAAWVPLAAAAALAAVLVFSRDDPFAGAPPGAPPPEPTMEPRVSVTPPADRAAAIMETENPDITIVWLYQREGT